MSSISSGKILFTSRYKCKIRHDGAFHNTTTWCSNVNKQEFRVRTRLYIARTSMFSINCMELYRFTFNLFFILLNRNNSYYFSVILIRNWKFIVYQQVYVICCMRGAHCKHSSCQTWKQVFFCLDEKTVLFCLLENKL